MPVGRCWCLDLQSAEGGMRRKMVSEAISGLVALAVLQLCSAASKVDHHTVKLHTAFIRDRKDDDFSKWNEAWLLADHDHDGKIPVQEAARVFKDHYNLVHMKDTGRGAAAEIHYMDDGNEFQKMVLDMRGWEGHKMMTYDEFLEALHDYVEIKHKERGALYDMAASIF